MEKATIYSPLAWAAGVLDTGGRFYITESAGKWSAKVLVRGPLTTLTEFASLVQLDAPVEEPLTIYAKDQERVLALLLPYMRTQIEEASAVYRYRVTAPKRDIGWHLTTPVEAYRKKLKEKL